MSEKRARIITPTNRAKIIITGIHGNKTVASIGVLIYGLVYTVHYIYTIIALQTIASERRSGSKAMGVRAMGMPWHKKHTSLKARRA